MIKVRSSVKASLMKKVLFRGTVMGGLGALLMVLGGLFLPRDLFSFLGLPTLIASSLLIGIGLIPYRKLSRLEMRPHEFLFDGETFLFSREGRPLFKIPRASVESIDYEEKEEHYGFKIALRPELREKMVVLQRNFDMKAFLTDSKTRYDCEIFLPYFTERSFKELQSFLQPYH